MSIVDARQLAKGVELFHGLTPEEVQKIFAKGITMKAQKGEVIFYKDTVGDTMYVVLGGKVGVFQGERCVAELRQGDMFGEMALVNREPRSATVAALEDAHLFMLNEHTFQKLLTKRVSIRLLLNIIHTLSKRLRDTTALVVR